MSFLDSVEENHPNVYSHMLEMAARGESASHIARVADAMMVAANEKAARQGRRVKPVAVPVFA